jgi:transcriptional regulator with XRE-family HTH domain
MPPQRLYVDPAFPATLRSLRQARDWTLRALGGRAFLSATQVWELEQGTKKPSLRSAAALDAALEAEGVLAAMVHVGAGVEAEDQERILHAMRKPARLDRHAVGALTEVLSAQRRLDDAIAARTLLPASVPQWRTVSQLARNARGPAADELHAVAAEWTQYVGWLQAEARQDGAAVRTLNQAAREAAALGSGPLLAQARNFLGYVQRQRSDPRGTARGFELAYRTPGAARLQRIGDAAQAAQGYALMGDPVTARQLLGEAQDLILHAGGDEPPETAYWLSVEFSHLNVGLAYLALQDYSEAEAHLQTGLASLPPYQQDAEWTAEYRRALMQARQGMS